MAIFFGTLGGCCPRETVTEQRVTCANSIVFLVALGALTAAIIGILAVAAHLSHGLAGLGAISQLGLPGGVPLTILGLIGFAVFVTLLVKRCHMYQAQLQEITQAFEQELVNRKLNPLKLNDSAPVKTLESANALAATEGAMPLENLPDELLLAIMHYLDEKSLNSFGLTNKRHFELTQSEFPFCFIRVGLRKEALKAWQASSQESWKDKKESYIHLSSTVRILVPFSIKTMLKETQQILNSIRTIKEKESALLYLAYSLRGMYYYTTDPETVINQVLQLFSITTQFTKQGQLSQADMQAILGAAFKPLTRDRRLSNACETHIWTHLAFDAESHITFLTDQIEIRANSNEVFIYLEKIKDAFLRDIQLCFILKLNIERHSKDNNILNIGRYILNQEYEGCDCIFKLAGAYTFIGEFESACALQHKVNPLKIGKLIYEIADQCNLDDPKRKEHLVSLLKWGKELLTLATDAQAKNALTRALSLVIVKIGRNDPIIKETLGNSHVLLIQSLLKARFIESEETFKLTKEMKDPFHKMNQLVILAKICSKRDKSRMIELLEAAFETYNTLTQHKSLAAVALAEVAELYAFIDSKRAKEILDHALQIVQKETLDDCSLTLIRAYVIINRKAFDMQACIDFIKSLNDEEYDRAYLLAKIAQQL